MLAGVFPLGARDAARWSIAGAWLLPVGSPIELGLPAAPGSPPFRENRGVEREGERVTHQGADLANGRAGDAVKAAAGGLVVRVARFDTSSGYGGHVVLAHRLPEGGIVYSVYAHLLPGSIRVQEGQRVQAGDPLARVGQTGRATTPHLHFEVRAGDDPALRWELARVVDPVRFVNARLPTRVAGPGRSPCLVWAQCAGLVPPGTEPADTLARAAWWRMLAAAAAGPPFDAPAEAAALRDSLVGRGVLPATARGLEPDSAASWREVARGIQRLRGLGVRPPCGPLAPAEQAAACRARFGVPAPAKHARGLATRRGVPTMLEACLLLADVAGPRALPRPAAGARRPRHRRAPAPAVAP